MIEAVLAVQIENEGQMTPDEALAILNAIPDIHPRRLLVEVHPDRHPEHRDEAAAAFQRVGLARELRGGRVSEVAFED